MPVEAQSVEYIYVGDGVTTTFPFPSRFLQPADIVVGVNGVAQTSGFNVIGAGGLGGGSVVFTAAPASGAKVVLLRKPPVSQLVDFVNGQTILEGTLDNALDKACMIDQYLLRAVGKSLRVPDLDTTTSTEDLALPSAQARAGRVLGFDSAGRPVPLQVPSATVQPGSDAASDMMTYGAVDDGAFNCAGALAAAKAAVGVGGTVRFRKVTTGRYYFGAGGADLSGITIDADDGVVLAGYVNLAYDIKTARPGLRIDYDADVKFTYYLNDKPDARVKPKISHLPDAEQRRRFLVRAAMWFPEKCLAWGADTWLVDGTASYSDANCGWTDLTNDSYLRAQFTSVWGEQGFRELTWCWSGVLPSNAGIGVAVKCSQGWITITALGDDSTMLVNRKAYGVGWTSANQSTIPQWYGRNYHQSWLPRQSVWTVRPLGPYDFALALNGVIIATFNTADLGWIMEQGPVVFGNQAGPMTVTCICATVEEGDRCNLAARVGVLGLGDSKLDNVAEASSPSRYPVSAFDYLCSYLDGSNGIRVTHAVNLAEAGATIAQQATKLTAFLATPAADNMTDAVIALSTNDIQGLTNYVSVYNTLGSMIDALKAKRIRCTVSIPDEFYSRALAASITGDANRGQPTVTYQTGALIRTVLRQQVVQKSVSGYEVGLVDGTRAIGLELADWLGNGYWTRPRLSDNIHGDGDLFPRELGFAMAREMFRLIAPRVNSDTAGLPLPSTYIGAGFSISGTMYLSYSRGRASILGKLTKSAGSWTAASVLTVPRCFRPASMSRHFIEDFNGGIGVAALNGAGGSQGVLQTFITTSSTATVIKADWLVER